MKRQTEVSFLDGKNNDYSGSETENDKRKNDLEMVNQCGPGKLPSSLYKGIVSQPNGGWGAQLCEKGRQIWLGAFHYEKDAASAKENADVRFRGQNVMTNFMPAEEGYPQILLSDDSNGETAEKLRKDHDEELDHSKNMSPTVTSQPSFLMGRLAMRVKAGKDIEEKGDRTAEKMENSGREHMFDKAVTPSDVGKLNRLVIPKQHAEKYLPLEKSGKDKGLVLSFEDSSGKEWWFRYSYWRSSQSYVLTKGWSRFVRDNKLHAGDIVSFDRATERLYISWRRRPCAALHPYKAALLPSPFQYTYFQSPDLNIRSCGSGQRQNVSSPSQWLPAAHIGGVLNRTAAIAMSAPTWMEQVNPNVGTQPAQPMTKDTSFLATEGRRGVAFGQNWITEPLQFMQLQAPESSKGDRSLPAENAGGTDHCPNRVRLFGVNL